MTGIQALVEPADTLTPAVRKDTAALVREMLFPADLSPESDRALEHATLLASSLHARLTVYHALEGHWGDARPDQRGPEDEAVRRASIVAREHLHARLEGTAADCVVLVEPAGSAKRALLKRIATQSPDLVVMATHGRGGLAHLVLGSVAETVVQFGHCPVLCVREPQHGAALPYRRVLVPTDLSEASRRAFPMAASVARAFGAELLALHVAQPIEGLAGVTEAVETSVPDDSRLAAFLAPETAGLKLQARVVLGSAWDRIVEVARVERADVIVMSTHGHDSLTDRVIGSHTERVVRHAPCPVLVV